MGGHHRRHQFAVAAVLLGLVVLAVVLVASEPDCASDAVVFADADVVDAAAIDAGADGLEELLALEDGLVPSGMEFETELADGDVAAVAEKVLESERDAGRSVVTSGYLDLYGNVWCALTGAAGETYVRVVRADEGSGGCVVQTMRIDAESLS